MLLKRCAIPKRPSRSLFEPARYRMFIPTIGIERSSCNIASNPLGKAYFSKGIFEGGIYGGIGHATGNAKKGAWNDAMVPDAVTPS